MISPPFLGHSGTMDASIALGRVLEPAASEVQTQRDARVRQLVETYFDFIWRSLRRLGLSADAADDAAQQVFVVAARKVSEITRESERAFLFSTALKVVADVRRTARRKPEVAFEEAGEPSDPNPTPDELLDRQRARAILDGILEKMDVDLRVVFVLFELEALTMAEIATTLEVPPGTVASRLRRAREEYESAIRRIRAQASRGVR